MFYLGSLISLVGILWLIVNAFRDDGMLWGLGTLLCGPAWLIYAILHFGANKGPIGLFIAGLILSAIGGVPADVVGQVQSLR
jgi:hypothetical protein